MQRSIISEKEQVKFGGSINLGCGRFSTPYFYWGVDFTLDISEKKQFEQINFSWKSENTTYTKSEIENIGVVPTVALRTGFYVPGPGFLVYARFGAAWVNAKLENSQMKDNKLEINKIMPIVGLGIEKNIGENFSLKLEGDYRFMAKDSCKGEMKFKDKYTDVTMKAEVSKYSARLMLVYHFSDKN